MVDTTVKVPSRCDRVSCFLPLRSGLAHSSIRSEGHGFGVRFPMPSYEGFGTRGKINHSFLLAFSFLFVILLKST